jgi:hypothetical protein
MSAWAEIKHAVNDGLGTKGFEPLNKIVEKEAYRSYYMNAFLDSLKNSNDDVKIIDEINVLGDEALSNDTTTKYFIFPPNELRFTGSYQFKQCTALERLDIPSSVRMEVGVGAFERCTSLRYASLDFVGNLPSEFFNGCSNLSFVRISKNITKIGGSVFKGCPFRKIVYGGTQNEWYEIEKDSQWLYGAFSPMMVECTDATIYVL